MDEAEAAGLTPGVWESCLASGDAAVRDALRDPLLANAKLCHPAIAGVGTALGGLIALGELVRGMCADEPQAQAQAEETALAYLRGSLRGAGQPINEDGSDYDPKLLQ